MKTSILILSAFMLAYLSPCHAEIYKWVDSDGKVHFDNNGANPLRGDFKAKRAIQSVKWQASKVTISASSQSVNKQQAEYNKQRDKRCLKTNKRISAISKQLSHGLIAQKFDALQVELRKLRWEKSKSC